ncbi:MAG: hypothetical protein ACOYMA_02075 [Bacteroidia bacterium]
MPSFYIDGPTALFNKIDMKNIKKILAILITLFILAIAVNAQPGSTGGFEDEPEDVPLDGGIL